ncbi:hypothetical protein BH09PLA1_BH09PLA1_01410 [soil metagenome]
MLDLPKLRRLVREKEDAGVTREELARRATMTPQHFWNHVSGEVGSDVRLSTLYALARAVEIEPKELLK